MLGFISMSILFGSIIPRKFTKSSSIMLRPILFFLVVLFSMYLADIEVDVSDDLESMSEQDR